MPEEMLKWRLERECCAQIGGHPAQPCTHPESPKHFFVTRDGKSCDEAMTFGRYID